MPQSIPAAPAEITAADRQIDSTPCPGPQARTSRGLHPVHGPGPWARRTFSPGP